MRDEPIRLAHSHAVGMQPTKGFDHESLLYLAAEEAALAIDMNRAKPGVRPRVWVQKLHDYEGFAVQESRTPRENTRDRRSLPPTERRLAEWARYQRDRRADLCAFQILRLDLSSVFRWSPQDDAWDENFDACAKHAEAHGTFPFLNSTDEDEFALARWLNRQLRLLQDGVLREDRAFRLNDLLNRARQLLH